jgi:hypothetical protein
MANEGLAADQGNVQRLVFLDEIKDTLDQRVAAEIGEIAQGLIAAKMLAAVGIASGAVQRALPRYFDGEHGSSAV